MFLFLKLYTAHLFGDFVFQFDELYRLKTKSHLGHVLHVLIHLLVSLVLVIPYWKYPFIFKFIGVICFVHLIQDILKYKLQKNIKWMFPAYMLDQLFHFLSLCSIFLFPISGLAERFTGNPTLESFYNEPSVTLYFIAAIWTTFGVTYCLHALRRSYFENTRPDHGITRFEMTYCFIERLTATFAILLSAPWSILGLSPLIGVFRLPFKKMRNMTDFMLSYGSAVFLGFLFRLWV
ncbi:MAG: hypothetical protein A2Z83_07465 [Omnitrophica bacterium GWA2_52_8]|nr:MAG: hypothetical protein A2Z83_07465 [Omnitrophica bacterium GWA2_52_8]